MNKLLIFSVLLFTFSSYGECQEIINLWPDGIPNSKRTSEQESIDTKNQIIWVQNVQEPTIQVFLPSKRMATGQAVLICPGGGYAGLAYDWEGTDIAKMLNARGITAFVLKSRLPASKSVVISHLAPLQDAQRALKTIRYYAEKWSVDPGKIGVMGFSAGGHLASTLGTNFTRVTYQAKDQIDQTSARPDFMILIYPVISMKKGITHPGSQEKLLGSDPSNELIEQYSNEKNINELTPPTFLVHSADDRTVSVYNSLNFYESLLKAGVEAEIHLFPKGGHGYGLAEGKGPHSSWGELLVNWLQYLQLP